jgi:hypothetical protein
MKRRLWIATGGGGGVSGRESDILILRIDEILIERKKGDEEIIIYLEIS